MPKFKHVRDMMGNDARHLRQALGKFFPGTETAAKQALSGDIEALKKVADMGLQGEFLKEYAPQIGDALASHIQGTTEAQKLYQRLYSEAGKGGQQINAGQKALALQDLQYQQKLAETQQRYELGVRAANHQHGITQSLGMRSAALQHHLRETDRIYQQQVIDVTPQVQQIQADRNHRRELQRAALQLGSDMRQELVIKKQPAKGLVQSVKNFFMIS